MPPDALLVTEALEASNSSGPCHSSRIPSRTGWQDPIVGNATLPGYIIQDINWNKLDASLLLASFHYVRKCTSGCWGKRHLSPVLSSSELYTLWCQLAGQDESIWATVESALLGDQALSPPEGIYARSLKPLMGRSWAPQGFLILSFS